MKPFERILGSSKVWIALGALVIVICSVIGLDADKATKVVTATTGVAFAVIAAIGYEDGQEKGATTTSVTTVADPSKAPSQN